VNYRYLLGVGSLLTALGCSDDGATNNPGGAAGSAGTGAGTGGSATAGSGGSSMNSAGSDTAGGGSGGSMPKACGPDASMNADGALTAYPNIGVTVTPATDFKITSFNFVVIEDDDPRGPLLKFFAELKNVGQGLQCNFLPSVHLDAKEIITLAYGPPRHLKIGDTVFTTVDECMGPGESVVLSGVQRGITEAALKTAVKLTVEPGPSNTETTVYLAADPPDILTPEVVSSTDGFGLKGTASYTKALHNHGIRVYPRDSRKLIVGELLAFPGDLGAHAAGSMTPFETNTTTCSFEQYELFQSWIED
jgi:hypothetical protein